MKILILTSINPVVPATIYSQIEESFTDENTSVICPVYFADIKARIRQGAYVPILFAMFSSLRIMP